LLGLLREPEGLAARVIESHGMKLDDTRALVAQIPGPGTEQVPAQIPFTPRAKRVVEQALQEARSRSHEWTGTEHVLLALAHEEHGVAAWILAELGAPPQVLAEHVRGLVGGPD
jgi:ATP-dependent Clp protease ATP-binding subunit ClpC